MKNITLKYENKIGDDTDFVFSEKCNRFWCKSINLFVAIQPVVGCVFHLLRLSACSTSWLLNLVILESDLALIHVGWLEGKSTEY